MYDTDVIPNLCSTFLGVKAVSIKLFIHSFFPSLSLSHFPMCFSTSLFERAQFYCRMRGTPSRSLFSY